MTTSNTSNNTATLAQVQLKQVIEQLNHLSTDELVNTYNDYADQNSYVRINNLDEGTINELYSSPWQALYDSNHKDFNDRDYFFTYNGNGHMISFSNEDDDNCPIDIEDLAQWIINNDLFNEYDLEVTTLEDMLASIEDNITDDSELLKTAINYLGVSTMTKGDDKVTDYNQYLINSVMDEIKYTDYETIKSVIDRLGINYE